STHVSAQAGPTLLLSQKQLRPTKFTGAVAMKHYRTFMKTILLLVAGGLLLSASATYPDPYATAYGGCDGPAAVDPGVDRGGGGAWLVGRRLAPGVGRRPGLPGWRLAWRARWRRAGWGRWRLRARGGLWARRGRAWRRPGARRRRELLKALGSSRHKDIFIRY